MYVSFKCLSVVLNQDLSHSTSEWLVSDTSSSVASDSSDATVIHDRNNVYKRTHIERESANEVLGNFSNK